MLQPSFAMMALPLAVASSLVLAPTLASARPGSTTAAPAEGKRDAAAPRSVTIDVVEVVDGKRETRTFVLSLDDDRHSHLRASDEATSYEIVVRLRPGDGARRVIELSLERSRRRDGRSRHAEVSVTRALERGKTTVVSRVAEEDGQLIVQATLR